MPEITPEQRAAAVETIYAAIWRNAACGVPAGLESALDALIAAGWSPTADAYRAGAEAGIEADVTVQPWTPREAADLREWARKGDIKSAKLLLEREGDLDERSYKAALTAASAACDEVAGQYCGDPENANHSGARDALHRAKRAIRAIPVPQPGEGGADG